jgi:hypothetical protein
MDRTREDIVGGAKKGKEGRGQEVMEKTGKGEKTGRKVL